MDLLRLKGSILRRKTADTFSQSLEPLTTSVGSKNSVNLGMIELTDSEEDVSSKPSRPPFHQPSSPTVIGSSPIQKGLKRLRSFDEVLEISSSSDEGDECPARKKKRSFSAA